MRNKSILCLATIMIMAIVLVGCGHKHDWQEATCDAPKTCSKCGETEGEALGHDYAKATCQIPATCTQCGATLGETADHSWSYATLDAPRTCEVCGDTIGDKVSVEARPMPILGKVVDEYKIIDKDRGVAVRYGNTSIDARIYDYEGNEIAKLDVPWENYAVFETVRGYVFYFDGDANGFKMYAYDREGEMQFNGVEFSANDFQDIPDFSNDWPGVVLASDTEIDICNFHDGAVHARFYLDSQQMLFEEGTSKAIPSPEFDTSDYEYLNYCSAIDGFYVKRISDEKHGYVDRNGNVIKIEYADATGFNSRGYALVTEDRKTYSIIDSHMNIVGKDVVEGDSAHIIADVDLFGVDKDGMMYTLVNVE